MKVENVYDSRDEASRKHTSLRKKFDIPIEHLEFSYIKNCSNERELEKILKILRSGEEGFYPDLEKSAAARLEAINPRNHVLRVEVPILKPESMDSDDRKRIQDDMAEWLNSMGQNESGKSKNTEIFTLADRAVAKSVNELPIRNPAKIIEVILRDGFIKKPNPNRIKSWEYDKWDKFDVDTELTKLEIENMKREEEIKRLEMESSKMKNKEKNALGMSQFKNPQHLSTSASSTNVPKKPNIKMEEEKAIKNSIPLGPSFIEEIKESQGQDTPKMKSKDKSAPGKCLSSVGIGNNMNTIAKSNPKRRVKVIIDDIHVD